MDGVLADNNGKEDCVSHDIADGDAEILRHSNQNNSCDKQSSPSSGCQDVMQYVNENNLNYGLNRGDGGNGCDGIINNGGDGVVDGYHDDNDDNLNKEDSNSDNSSISSEESIVSSMDSENSNEDVEDGTQDEDVGSCKIIVDDTDKSVSKSNHKSCELDLSNDNISIVAAACTIIDTE